MVLGQLEVIHHTQGKRITLEEFQQRIDHVRALDLDITNLLELVTEHLRLVRFDHQNASCREEALLGRSGKHTPERCKNDTENDDPCVGLDGIVILPPIKALLP